MDWALLYYIIPSVLGVAAVITIIVIYAKKLSKLSSLDLDAMPEYRQKLRKSSLVEDRLSRKVAAFRSKTWAMLVPIGHFITKLLRKFFYRLRHLEDKYKKDAAKKVGPQNVAQQVQSAGTLVQQAQAFWEEGNLAEAENKYIEAVAADNTSIPAYRGLAQVYVERKDMEHAIETMKFLQQLNPQDEAVWRELGKLYKDQDMTLEAFEAYEQAAELGPNNPKNLDALLEVAIAQKKKYEARNTLEKLRAVNPDNKKLDDYGRQVAEL